MVGAGIASPLLVAIIQYMLNVGFTTLGMFLGDNWGRRPTLLAGSVVMMLCLAAMGNYLFTPVQMKHTHAHGS